ncbi:hypothetical protein G4Y79_18600 [Phototrophicus methaneseepsis]|uniref:Uncharacterized protein n=1 Tax=Phototrophicus methaneseepsis TaxID=2710758 RepID=A0A7S8E7A0_9CHLR|nr:hypothetical protein [Phototrophicus methaneseepsis]QPC81681.1 hypothetical protein G4Y79_18600 [Phototrophicus methaneseepsis]
MVVTRRYLSASRIAQTLGCRWSKRQKAWYLIGQSLPEAVQNLIERESTAPEVEIVSDEDGHDPCTLEEAAKVLGLQVNVEQFTAPHCVYST